MNTKALLAAMAIKFAAIAPAFAAPVTIEWSATVTSLSNFDAPALSFGDSITGTATFDDEAIGSTNASVGAVFPLIAMTATFPTLGGLTFHGDVSFFRQGLDIGDNLPTLNDRLSLYAHFPDFNPENLPGDTVTADIMLRDRDNAAFSSTSILELVAVADSADLSAFEVAFYRILFRGDGVWGECVSRCTLFASLDSTSIVETVGEVPLPAAFPLFLAGLAGLGFASRNQRK